MKFYNLLGAKPFLSSLHPLSARWLPKAGPELTRRIIMRAKMIFIFMLTLFLQLSMAASAQRISISMKNTTLKAILKQIGKQSGYQFVLRR